MVVALLGIAFAGFADEARPSISVEHVATQWRNLKPPLRVYYIELKIRNQRSTPTWYITRYSGDKALISEPSFQMIDPWKKGYFIPSSVKSTTRENGSWFESLRVIADRTENGSHSFEAFLLPAKGVLHHSYFGIEAWAPIDSVEIWEVSALLVDGKTPLEDWLPFDVSSTPTVTITKDDVEDWRFKMLSSRLKPGKTWEDWPADGVKNLTPKVVRKHLFPIEIPPIPRDKPKQAEQGGAGQAPTRAESK